MGKGLDNYHRELGESIEELKGVRKKLYVANIFTPLITVVAGAYLGYELCDILSDYIEYPTYFLNMCGGAFGFASGWFGGLCLANKIFNLLNPKRREIFERFERDYPEEFEREVDKFRFIPKRRK